LTIWVTDSFLQIILLHFNKSVLCFNYLFSGIMTISKKKLWGIKIKITILWHDAWKPEQRSQCKRSLLGNGSINTFLRQRICKQQSKYSWAVTMEMVFSVGSTPRLYNGIPSQLRNTWGSLLRQQLKMIEKIWQWVSWVTRVRLWKEDFMYTAVTVRLV
jgi:hypothetical protein